MSQEIAAQRSCTLHTTLLTTGTEATCWHTPTSCVMLRSEHHSFSCRLLLGCHGWRGRAAE